jgi:hypothetical protein
LLSSFCLFFLRLPRTNTTAVGATGRVKVFLLSVGQGARGLTLTVASTIVMMEPAESAAEEAQAMNRCHRIGQGKPVRFITLYARRTVEERMLSLRQHKGEFSAGAGSGSRAGASGRKRHGHGAAASGAGAAGAAGASDAGASAGREVAGPSGGVLKVTGTGAPQESELDATAGETEELSQLQDLNSVTWSPAELRYLAGLGSEHLISAPQ